MKLIEFIDKINTPNSPVFTTNVVLHFQFGPAGVNPKGKYGGQYQYPLLFFSFLMRKLKKTLPFDVETINLASQKPSITKSKLATSFLGQKKLYWLGDISALKAKEKKLWVEYIKNYNGPNIIACFSDGTVNISKPSDKSKIKIEVAHFVDQKLFLKLVAFCAKPVTKSSLKILTDIFVKQNKLTLDITCMLMNYIFLAGKKHKEFSEQWLNKIITPERSLFTLSQYFFARNSKQFFTLWQELQDEYAEQFWIAFWSEQLWRACNVIKLMRERNMAEARKVNFRLPFSFMQRDWRNFTSKELTNAHNFLYSIDYSLKNGGDPFVLDLFYSKFLHKQFCA